jgi:hypothetical protein
VRALGASKFPHRMVRRSTAAASLTALLAAAALAAPPALAQEPPPSVPEAPPGPGTPEDPANPEGPSAPEAPEAEAEAAAVVPYRAAAEATALELSLFGQGLTVGLSQTAVDGVPSATSYAVGALLPGLPAGEERADLANLGDGQPTCSELTLPPEIQVVDLAVACGNATAAAGEDGPGSTSSAGVATISVSATELLTETPLADVAAQLPVQETVDQLLGGLAPVFEVVSQLGLDAQSLVPELLGGITQGGELVRIELGPSTATSGASGTSTTASAGAQGAVIHVVDRALLSLPPVLTIEVGASAARVVAERETGTATPEIDPALVRVTVAEDIANLIGLPAEARSVEVALDQDLCIPLPEPLQSCITVAGGRVVDAEDGGKRAESEGVSLRLLTGLPGGGIVLNLAASAAEAAAAVPETPRQAPEPPAEALARTGIEDNLPLAAALVLFGAAGLALVAASSRRRLTD